MTDYTDHYITQSDVKLTRAAWRCYDKAVQLAIEDDCSAIYVCHLMEALLLDQTVQRYMEQVGLTTENVLGNIKTCILSPAGKDKTINGPTNTVVSMLRRGADWASSYTYRAVTPLDVFLSGVMIFGHERLVNPMLGDPVVGRCRIPSGNKMRVVAIGRRVR